MIQQFSIVLHLVLDLYASRFFVYHIPVYNVQMLSSAEGDDTGEFVGEGEGQRTETSEKLSLEKSAGDNHRKSGIPAAVLIPAPVWTTT